MAEAEHLKTIDRLGTLISVGSFIASVGAGIMAVSRWLDGNSWSMSIVLTLFAVCMLLWLCERFGATALRILGLRLPERTAGSSPAPVPHPAPSSGAKVRFWIPGGASDLTGFRVRQTDSDARGAIYSEEIWLRIEAVNNLEGVEVIVELTHDRLKDLEFKLKDDFFGSVSRGRKVDIKVMDRRFYFANARFDDGRSVTTRVNLNEAELFPAFGGIRATKNLYHVKVAVHHRDGPDQASFAIDLSEVNMRPITKLRSLFSISFLGE